MRPIRPFDPARAQQAAQVGGTNQVAQVINNINIGGQEGGMGMPPILGGLQGGPQGDLCQFAGRPPMGLEGRPPMGPEGHCCCGGDSELADFGNSAMGKGIGKAAKYNGIANIVMAALSGGGNFLQGLFGGQGIWGYQNA